MIKIILLCLLLTGCNKELSNTCIKVDNQDVYKVTNTIVINFNGNVMNSIVIDEDYYSDDESIIAAISASINTLSLDIIDMKEIILEEVNNLIVRYNIDDIDKAKDYFKIKDTRSDYITYLKKEGYTCS